MSPADGPDEMTAVRRLPTASSTAIAPSTQYSRSHVAGLRARPRAIEHDHTTPCRQPPEVRSGVRVRGRLHCVVAEAATA